MILIVVCIIIFIISCNLVVFSSKPMGLLMCLEMYALITLLLSIHFCSSASVTFTISLSFWLMVFIILGATMGLIVMSATLNSSKTFPAPLMSSLFS